MAPRFDKRKEELIEKAAALARKQLKGARAAQTETFLRTFYANVPPGDIAERDPETLCAAARSFWEFARQRKPGVPKLRVFNPRAEAHGWTSSHTVIEIVNDDMPFLVDSVAGEINYQGLTVHLVIHPIVLVARNDSGRLVRSQAEPDEGLVRESFMHVEIDARAQPAVLARITSEIERVLDDVRAAVEDWGAMREKVETILEDMRANPPKLPLAEVEDAEAFLQWMADDHFTFLGYREYVHAGSGEQQRLKPRPGGLGLLRDEQRTIFESWAHDGALPEDVRDFIRKPKQLMITKANRRSTVHRRTHMDVIGVKSFDGNGKVIGERMIVGLFTSVAYSRSPMAIPLLRQKVERVLARAGFPPASHDAKALAHILENYPRDELLQIDEGLLLDHALGILDLQERQRTALFIREDPFQRYLTALVFVPRDRYDTELRIRLAGILESMLAGTVVAYFPEFGTDSVLAQVLFVVKTGPGGIPSYDSVEIEMALREATRSWEDRLRDALVAARGEEAGLLLFERYGDAFPAGYRDRYAPEVAVADLDLIDAARSEGTLQLDLYRREAEPNNALRLKLCHDSRPLPLSDVLPMLENMGLKVLGEEPFRINYHYGEGAGAVWIHDFAMMTRAETPVLLDEVRANFHECFARVFAGQNADDGFNKLVLGAGLQWREVLVLRAYCKYLLQACIAFSQAYMEETLANNPTLAAAIVALFCARFDPAVADAPATKRRLKRLRGEIAEELDAVTNLDEDRIIRRFVNAVESTLRTNYFQTDENGDPKPYFSFKLDSRAVDELPEPRPKTEIFVYSPRMDGCHLRGGDVARGGIRWSDRREDFRTEILGLLKAQMVKNAVIVPVGAKGGFVCKQLPAPTGEPQADRRAIQDEVIACYRTLICGMLDLTDNLSGTAVVPPPQVVRYDGDDPYLVVAADKGTATFSDIANAISAEYDFWLGDAFASGGSAGYDHKEMGITARGAWESVKRHFREMGHDTQSEDFTVIGVGDMSGDVFGNGMLQSKHIRLLGAFNHLHIFVDPDPDPKKSFAERKRLFDLPRSSWSDYDTGTISKGGGVFDRKAKSIKLTPEMKRLFGLNRDQVTPNELIRTMLAAEVDLLWFGGIGTYVKASDESHADADDRSNDALRVDGETVRARVIGEGANLGATQRGRIEYARSGGRINTDFIDNSAGVDTSDHEVNIKIALREVLASGKLGIEARNELLEDMTEEVARLVLNDNYLQTQALSQAEAQAADLLDSQWRALRALERRGLINRALERLPDDEEMGERQSAGTGLTRPEYAVLFSHAKIALYGDLLPTGVPDEPYLVNDLARYFPEPLRERFARQISRHRLRREIVATYVTNSLINRVGAAFVQDLQERSGAAAADIACAYVVARDAFALRPVWRSIELLDNKIEARVQYTMAHQLEMLVERMTIWFVQNVSRPIAVKETIERYAPGIQTLVDNLPEIVAAPDRRAIEKQVKALTERKVPRELARKVASLDVLAAAGDVVRIARNAQVPVLETARIYFELGAQLGIDWMRQCAKTVDPGSEWERLALEAIVDDSYRHQSEITTRVLDLAGGGKIGEKAADGVIGIWMGSRDGAVERTRKLVDDLRGNDTVDLAMLTVANGQLRSLVSA